MPSEVHSAPSPCDSASRRNRNSLIGRDLDDIYLILDHLSGRADKNVSSLMIDIEAETAQSQDDQVASAAPSIQNAPVAPAVQTPPKTSFTTPPVIKKNLIQSVCEIEGWPPTSQTRYNARAATTLFKARDLLNEIAWPASGMTIAYTIMVTDLSKQAQSLSSQRVRNERKPSLVQNGHGDTEQQLSFSTSTGEDGTQIGDGDAARTNLAISAYPHLLQPARRLRKWIVINIFMLIGLLAFTAVLSWNVAAGKLIIERLNQLKVRETLEAARLLSAEGDPGTTLQGISTTTDDVPDAGYVFDTLCTTDGTALPHEKPSPAVQSSASLVRLDSLCGKGLAILDQRFAADASLKQWFGLWKRVTSWGWGLAAETEGLENNNRLRIRNAALMEQQAGDANSVFASYVLPMLYGLLGAMTATIRNLNSKMRESTLAPRDLRVSQVQLALGIIVGACIGLFLSPTGAPDARLPNVTLAGNDVSLSASALSFIAGFGVEAVFKWLEVIITIAFAAGGAAVGQHASPIARQPARQP